VLRSDMATVLRIPRPSVHLALIAGQKSYMPIFLQRRRLVKHTRLVVRPMGLGEAQAEGVVAILVLVLLAFGAALMVHWG